MPQIMFSHENFYTNAFNKLNEVIEIVNSLSASNFTASLGYPVNVEIVDTFIPYVNGNKASGLSFSVETYFNGTTSSVSATVAELTGSLTGAYSLTFTPSATGFWLINMESTSAVNQAYYFVSSLTGISSGGGGTGNSSATGEIGQVSVFSGTSSLTGYSDLIYDSNGLSASRVYASTTAQSDNLELVTVGYLSAELSYMSSDSGYSWKDATINDTFVIYNQDHERVSGLSFTATIYANGATSSTTSSISDIGNGAYTLMFVPDTTGNWMVDLQSESAIVQAYYFIVDSLTGTNVANVAGSTGQVGVFNGLSSVTGYSSFTFDSGSVSASVFYASTTSVTTDNQLITKAYLDSITGDLGVNLIYITATGSATGDLHLSDTSNWGVSKANIKYIRVDTTSTAWNMYLLQNDNGYATNDAMIPALEIVNNGYLNELTYMDHPYWDEDNTDEVHLYWDSSDTATVTASIYIVGNELK